MSNPVTTEYGGIAITYDERDDVWRFELRGRERKADTLAKAKEAIDKPAPQEKTFKPLEAYVTNYGMAIEPATITSIAEPSYGKFQVWCTINGERRKKELSDFFAITPENESLVVECGELDKKIKWLEALKSETWRKIPRFTPNDLSGGAE